VDVAGKLYRAVLPLSTAFWALQFVDASYLVARPGVSEGAFRVVFYATVRAYAATRCVWRCHGLCLQVTPKLQFHLSTPIWPHRMWDSF